MDLTLHYFLFEAYDRLGRHLYGPAWKGDEYGQSPLDPPDEMIAKRQPIELERDTAEKITREIDAQIAKTISLEETARLKQERTRQFGIRNAAQARLREIREPDQYYRAMCEAYRRRTQAENHLIDAFKAGKIEAMHDTGMIVDPGLWYRPWDFHCYINLSLGIFAKHTGFGRRAALFVNRDQFDSWFKSVPREFDPEPPSPQALCEEHLKAHFRSGDKTKIKSELREECVRRFPGLTKRQFEAVWNRIAPPDSKRPGPRKKNKSSRQD